jgi:hypothetical protein
MRSSARDLHLQAIEDVLAAFEDAGIRVKRRDRGAGQVGDLDIYFDGGRLELQIKAVAYGTVERVRDLVARSKKTSAVIPILVADRITDDAREMLHDTGWGWLDRRGHLAIHASGVLIDRGFSPIFRRSDSKAPIAGLAGRAVAYALLTDPKNALPVRQSAPLLRISPASISNARARLRENGLVDRDGKAVLPELFWALAEVWQPARTWLETAPNPKDPNAKSNDLEVAGWCLTGTAAAAEWGAQVTVTAGSLDLYVPGPVVVSIAVRRFGAAADPLGASASMAVAPTWMISARRYPPITGKWPLAHPVAVALDLAQDLGRGREILKDWKPPTGFTRVWK